MEKNYIIQNIIFESNMEIVPEEEVEEMLELEREEQERRELEEDLLASLYTARYPIRDISEPMLEKGGNPHEHT